MRTKKRGGRVWSGGSDRKGDAPLGLDGAEEELRAVGVGASVGHREDAGASVLVDEVLVGKLGAVDRLAASACGQRLRLVSDCSLREAAPSRLGFERSATHARQKQSVLPEFFFARGLDGLLPFMLVKSPPWIMKLGMMRWKGQP